MLANLQRRFWSQDVSLNKNSIFSYTRFDCTFAEPQSVLRMNRGSGVSWRQSMELPACHPLSFETTQLLLFLFELRWFCFDVNRLFLGRCHEDICCDVFVQILLRFALLDFVQLLHHLPLTDFGCCSKTDLSAMLQDVEKKKKIMNDNFTKICSQFLHWFKNNNVWIIQKS